MPGPVPLTMRRWFRLYLPLSLTFLLMSGSSPIVNKGIGRAPDETLGLAAFVNAFSLCIFLYSPVFAVRDAALKYVRGRTSYRRVLVFHLFVALATMGLMVLVAFTTIFDEFALRGAMNLSDEVFVRVKRSIPAFLPIPILVTIRGVHQAAHITNDTANWVGIGTAGRFVTLIAFVFLVGVPLGIEGAVLGGLAFSVGIATEATIVAVTARRKVHFLRRDHPSQPAPGLSVVWMFVWPLILANGMGVFLQPLTASIVNSAILEETSAAAFGVVRSFTWFFCSTLFAMQAMALAKADSVPNLRRLLVYALIPVGLFTSLILAVVAVPGIRRLVIEGFFELDATDTIEFIRETLPFALVLPTIMALRASGRGLLMRGGRTGFVTFASLSSLGALLLVKVLSPVSEMENGAVGGYMAWIGALGIETVLLVFAVLRAGIHHCVTEGGRSSALPAEALAARASTPSGSGRRSE